MATARKWWSWWRNSGLIYGGLSLHKDEGRWFINITERLKINGGYTWGWKFIIFGFELSWNFRHFTFRIELLWLYIAIVINLAPKDKR